MVRKNPAISHQPPSFSGGMIAGHSAGGGGSSASQGSCRTNWTGSQFTEAHMLSPMISIAMKPQISEATPSEAQIDRADLRVTELARASRRSRPPSRDRRCPRGERDAGIGRGPDLHRVKMF